VLTSEALKTASPEQKQAAQQIAGLLRELTVMVKLAGLKLSFEE
jgi:hypothetical protein